MKTTEDLIKELGTFRWDSFDPFPHDTWKFTGGDPSRTWSAFAPSLPGNGTDGVPMEKQPTTNSKIKTIKEKKRRLII